jgi:hypothetical protein
MVTGDLVRPARSWRLLLLVALLVALVAVVLVAAHALLGGLPAAHAQQVAGNCPGTPTPC